MQALRPYQAAAIERLRDAARAGAHRLLLVAPTGAGKTTIAAHLIHGAIQRGSSVQFWAHRQELISQCAARLAQHEIPHGIMQGARTIARHEPVQVVSVPTLVRRLDRVPPADLVIVDEAHRSVSASYRACMEHVSRARLIGLTATPYRSDGAALGDLYERLVVVAQPDELVREGYLIEPELYAPDRPDLDGVRSRAGDYVAEQLAERMIRLSGNVVKTWMRLASQARTVVFACNVNHSTHLASRFRAEGVAAEHVDGETPAPERDAILGRLRSGETRVVTNVGILTEGWDLPSLGACVLARPTKSRGLYLQMVGRVLRPDASKSVALVIDHGGNIERHGPPTWPQEHSLEGSEAQVSARADGPTVRTCGKCFACWSGTDRACPKCGYVPPGPEIPEEEEDVEVRRVVVPSADRAIDEIRRLQRIAEERGYSPGWVAHRYKGRYGSWPSKWLIEAARASA